MKKWSIIIKGHVTMSANVFMRLPRLRKGWRRRAGVHYQQTEISDWYYHLLEAGVRDIPPATRKKKRKVHVIRQSPRPIDRLNAATPIDKCLLDNLVRLGILRDDSDEWAEISFETKRGPLEMRVEISE